jgi:hypothetical protein
MTTYAVETPRGFEPVTRDQFILRKDGAVKSSVAAIVREGWQADYGVHAVEPEPVPEGKRAVGAARIEARDGRPVLVRNYEDLPPPPEPTFDERVEQAVSQAGALPTLVYEIIMAMNHAQLSGQVDWPAPMDRIINKVLAAQVERPVEEKQGVSR